MTGVTRWNKTISKAGADGWNLTTDDGKGLDSANVIVPVATQAERDGLTPPTGKYAGMIAGRNDIPGALDIYDGAAWARNSATTITTVTSGDATWAYNTKMMSRICSDGTTKDVTLDFIVARTSGGAFTVDSTAWVSLFAGFIPAGFRPTDWAHNVGTYEFNGFGPVAIRVDTSGNVSARALSGSFSCGLPTALRVSLGWYA